MIPLSSCIQSPYEICDVNLILVSLKKIGSWYKLSKVIIVFAILKLYCKMSRYRFFCIWHFLSPLSLQDLSSLILQILAQFTPNISSIQFVFFSTSQNLLPRYWLFHTSFHLTSSSSSPFCLVLFTDSSFGCTHLLFVSWRQSIWV